MQPWLVGIACIFPRSKQSDINSIWIYHQEVEELNSLIEEKGELGKLAEEDRAKLLGEMKDLEVKVMKAFLNCSKKNVICNLSKLQVDNLIYG